MPPERRLPYPDHVLACRGRLGLRIAQLRHAAGMSQDQLAGRAFVSRQSVMRWEAGRQDPRYLELVLLAEALDTSVMHLVDVDAPPRSGTVGGGPHEV